MVNETVLTQKAGAEGEDGGLPACLSIKDICADTGLIHPEVRPVIATLGVPLQRSGHNWIVLRTDYLPVRDRLRELGRELRRTANKGGRPRRREAAVA